MLQEASLSQEVQKSSTNRYVIKCFFRVTHLLIIQKWAHTSNFKNVVELIACCGGDEVKTHLLNAPGNAMHLSPLYIPKYTDIMSSYIKESLLASLRPGKFALYNDETQNITSTEQMTIYATFKHNGTIGEHFEGIIPISKLAESTLSAKTILSALENYLQSLDISFLNARFFCVDTTNVNSGERSGLKRHLKHTVPPGVWIGCGNHKLPLCFKHLSPLFSKIFSADATLTALWKFFHYRPLGMGFIENAAEVFQEDSIVPVYPSATRWTAHDRACKIICDGYKQYLASSFCVNERNEPDAMGIFEQLSSPQFISTILHL